MISDFRSYAGRIELIGYSSWYCPTLSAQFLAAWLTLDATGAFVSCCTATANTAGSGPGLGVEMMDCINGSGFGAGALVVGPLGPSEWPYLASFPGAGLAV